MTEYIKREDINKLLNDLSFVTKTVIYNRMTGHTLEDIMEHDFSELSSADVRENVKGEWVDFSMSIKGVPTEACGVCGEWSLGMGKNFCPNCGADMRGEA